MSKLQEVSCRMYIHSTRCNVVRGALRAVKTHTDTCIYMYVGGAMRSYHVEPRATLQGTSVHRDFWRQFFEPALPALPALGSPGQPPCRRAAVWLGCACRCPELAESHNAATTV
jgi:hypothetical protein